MKVLVTGANGFLGSHLVDRLLERGDEVHVLIRKTSNVRWLIEKNVQYHYGDVVGTSKGLEKGLEGADVVFHVAGVIRARAKKTYYEVNVQGTENVLKTCLSVNPTIKRIVVTTSIAAHGPNYPKIAGSEDFSSVEAATESDECRPLTEYGKSKREAEKLALRYMDRLPISIVRPPAIYGPRDEQILSFFKMLKRGLVLLPGKDSRILSLAHVQDIVTGHLLAAESPKAVGEIFFIGENRNYSWEEATKIIGEALHRRPKAIHVPEALIFGIAGVTELLSLMMKRTFSMGLDNARNFIQKSWAMDVSKAKKLLGYESAYSLAKGSEETAAWYEEEGWL